MARYALFKQFHVFVVASGALRRMFVQSVEPDQGAATFKEAVDA